MFPATFRKVQINVTFADWSIIYKNVVTKVNPVYSFSSHKYRRSFLFDTFFSLPLGACASLRRHRASAEDLQLGWWLT
jgi:hypothetical protein